MKVGSLFAGIGGFDLAAEQVGWTTAWYSEIDPYASAVMRKQFPQAVNHGDVTKINGRAVEPIDVLCGGFPCQDISLAGKGVGLEGARSGLWSHYARLIDELRPRWVVVENVSALRSRGLDQVLGAVAALGYDAEWHCIPASYVGAPHRRDRVWIVAWRADTDSARPQGWLGKLVQERAGKWSVGAVGSSVADTNGINRWSGPVTEAQGRVVPANGGSVMAYPNGERQQQPQGFESDIRRWISDGGETILDADSTRRVGQNDKILTGRDTPFRAGWWGTEPDVGRVANGVPSRVDRLRCLGNAIVPQVAEVIFREIDHYEGSTMRLAA